MVKWGSLASLGLVAGTSLLGGIAYQANHQALSVKPSVQVYPQQLKTSPSQTPAEQLKAHKSQVTSSHARSSEAGSAESKAAPSKSAQTKSTHARSDPTRGGPIRIMVPAETVREFSHQVQDTAQFKALLQNQSQKAAHDLEQQVAVLKVPDSQVLLDVNLPLPTSDRAFLNVGGVDLPSLGMRALTQEQVPLALDYSTQPVSTGLQVDIQAVDAPAGLQGPGILIGAVQVNLRAPAGKIPIQGHLQLHTDLDGSSTQARLDQLQGKPGQEPLIQQLQQRLSQGQRLQGLLDEQGLNQTLQQGFGQKVEFEANLVTGKAALAGSTLYLWAVPDYSGDGKADIQVTQANQVDGLSQVKVEVTRFDQGDQPPQGKVAAYLHGQVQKALQTGLQQNLPKVTQDLQRLASERAEKEFAKGGPLLEQIANQQLNSLYSRNQSLQFNTGNPLAPLLSAQVSQVQVTPEGLLIDLQSAAGGTGHAEFTGDLKLKPGQLAAGIDLSVINTQLRKIDWKPILEQARQKADLLDLQFGKNASPQLTFQNGRLLAQFEVTASLKGAQPAKGATGLVTGATGALDSGMGQVQKTLKKEAGGFGQVVGGILRAPFFLVDKVAEGGKAVVDNTVGKVIDAVPEVATRPTIHTRISVPLTLSTDQGSLHVGLDGKAVEFQKAQSQSPFDLLDLLPTRLLSNLIVGAVADAQGAAQVGQQLQKQGLDVNLQNTLGISMDEIRVGPQGDLTLIMKTTQKTANLAAQKLP